jgi:hypothetical protein
LFFNGIRLYLLCRVSPVIPLAVEWKITAESYPAMFRGETLPALDRCGSLFCRHPTLLQSVFRMVMQPDVHIRRSPSGIRMKGLGLSSRDTGHNRVPAPPARINGTSTIAYLQRK